MKKTIIGYPRVGENRELKFWTESYFKKEITKEELLKNAEELRKKQWQLQKEKQIDYIPSNDFSFYDGMLDTAYLLNAIPKEYEELKLNELDTYFAMARGYQGSNGDVKALAMKKWFNTNYHYMVPELYDDTEIKLNSDKPFKEWIEAKNLGIETKPVVIGGFTFLKLAKINGSKKINDYVEDIAEAYINILNEFNTIKAKVIQIDEPILVTDLSKDDIRLFADLYKKILSKKGNLKVLLQTYFGDIRDVYNEVINMDFDGIGLDFIEGKKTLELINKYGFPQDKVLFAGVVNGKNIWKCNYKKVYDILNKVADKVNNIVINTSCSLLHVPYTLRNEKKLDEDIVKHLVFAEEKLQELKELGQLFSKENLKNKSVEQEELYKTNLNLFLQDKKYLDKSVQEDVKNIKGMDFIREVERSKRQKIQREKFNLPLLPTTTIGSFPQTKEVKHNRTIYRKGEITKNQYD